MYVFNLCSYPGMSLHVIAPTYGSLFVAHAVLWQRRWPVTHNSYHCLLQVYEKNEMKGAALKSKEQLAAVFQQAGVDLSQPVVATCGSGLTACVLALAVHELTGRLVPVYDGSWSEWGARQDTPIDSEAQQA